MNQLFEYFLSMFTEALFEVEDFEAAKTNATDYRNSTWPNTVGDNSTDTRSAAFNNTSELISPHSVIFSGILLLNLCCWFALSITFRRLHTGPYEDGYLKGWGIAELQDSRPVGQESPLKTIRHRSTLVLW